MRNFFVGTLRGRSFCSARSSTSKVARAPRDDLFPRRRAGPPRGVSRSIPSSQPSSGGLISGVYVQAAAVNNLLRREAVVELSNRVRWLIALGAAALGAAAALRLTPYTRSARLRDPLLRRRNGHGCRLPSSRCPPARRDRAGRAFRARRDDRLPAVRDRQGQAAVTADLRVLSAVLRLSRSYSPPASRPSSAARCARSRLSFPTSCDFRRWRKRCRRPISWRC